MIIDPKAFEKEREIILKVVAVATVITALAGAYYFFVNNVWKPKVKVLSVDFDNGFATIEMPFGKKVDIYGHLETFKSAPTKSAVKKRYTNMNNLIRELKDNRKIFKVLE
jgi:hypothetical protein